MSENNLGASSATVVGSASRFSPAQAAAQAGLPVAIEEGVALLRAQGGTLTAQISVTRKATGKVEHYTLTMGEQPKEA